uniref:Uncharacterized protein n=1 Tax=Kalanchoe fedtschenkoi TaxID=63787 RepID=A0A7N0TUI7_KALFE
MLHEPITRKNIQGYLASLNTRVKVNADGFNIPFQSHTLRLDPAFDSVIFLNQNFGLNAGTLCFASGKPAKKWTYWGRSY